MPYRATQNVNDVIAYEVEVADESVASAAWTSSPSGATITGSEMFSNGKNGGARCFFTAPRGRYTLTAHLIATSGQEFERDIVIEVTRL